MAWWKAKTQPDERAAIRDFLRRESAALSSELSSPSGAVPLGRIRRLVALGRLLDVQEAALAPRPRRWPVIIVLAVTLAVVSALFFMRVSETQIELDVRATEVAFDVQSSQIINDIMPLLSVGIAGAAEVHLPSSEGGEPRVLHDQTIKLSAVDTPQNLVSLASLVLPANTRIWLRKMDAPRHYRLSFQRPDQELWIDVHGLIRLHTVGAPPEDHRYRIPARVLVRSGAADVDLDLELAQPVTRWSQVLASNLALFRINRVINPEGPASRELSTVLSGKIYFESSSGAERQLRPGEVVRFQGSVGEIRNLTLAEDGIALQFYGRVRDVRTGSTDYARSLMPTSLEWLQARHGVTLLWGSALYAFTLVLSILRFWGFKL